MLSYKGVKEEGDVWHPEIHVVPPSQMAQVTVDPATLT